MTTLFTHLAMQAKNLPCLIKPAASLPGAIREISTFNTFNSQIGDYANLASDLPQTEFELPATKIQIKKNLIAAPAKSLNLNNDKSEQSPAPLLPLWEQAPEELMRSEPQLTAKRDHPLTRLRQLLPQGDKETTANAVLSKNERPKSENIISQNLSPDFLQPEFELPVTKIRKRILQSTDSEQPEHKKNIIAESAKSLNTNNDKSAQIRGEHPLAANSNSPPIRLLPSLNFLRSQEEKESTIKALSHIASKKKEPKSENIFSQNLSPDLPQTEFELPATKIQKKISQASDRKQPEHKKSLITKPEKLLKANNEKPEGPMRGEQPLAANSNSPHIHLRRLFSQEDKETTAEPGRHESSKNEPPKLITTTEKSIAAIHPAKTHITAENASATPKPKEANYPVIGVKVGRVIVRTKPKPAKFSPKSQRPSLPSNDSVSLLHYLNQHNVD